MFDKILGLLGFHVTQWETIIIVKTVQDQNSELWFTGSEHPSCKTLTNWELHPPPPQEAFFPRGIYMYTL